MMNVSVNQPFFSKASGNLLLRGCHYPISGFLLFALTYRWDAVDREPIFYCSQKRKIPPLSRQGFLKAGRVFRGA